MNREQTIEEIKNLVVLEVIRVRSAVDEILKEIKSAKKARRRGRRKKKKKSMDSTLFSRFYSLKNVYYIIQCACIASFSLSLSLSYSLSRAFFFSFVILLTPSLVCYDKRKIIPFSNVLLTTFTFAGVQLRFKCPINCLKTCFFYTLQRRRCYCCFLK